MSSTVDRVSLIEERFPKSEARHVPFSTTATSWLSVAVLFQTAWYCYSMLKNSCSTFHFLETAASKTPGLFKRFFSQPALTCVQDRTAPSLIRKLFCMFPRTLPVPLIRTISPDYRFYYPTCSTEQLLQQTISSSWLRVNGWILLPFLVKIIFAYVAFLHEICLLPGGRTDPSSKTWVFKLLRQSMLAWTTASSCLIALSFTVKPGDSIQLFMLLQVVCFMAVGMSAALFFRRTSLRHRAGLAAIHTVKLAIVLSRGTVVGGSDLTFLLVTESVLEIAAVLVRVDVVPDPLSSAYFNILTTLSMLALYAAIVLVGNANPGFPEKYADVFFPSETIGTVIVVCILSGSLGFIMTMLLSPPTYQAFRTMCSGILWSFLQVLLLSSSFVKNPYKLSEVYDKEHPPVRLTLKPFWQQHPLYMPKRLDLPTIASDELPRTIEIFKELKSAIKAGFRLLCWLDYHFPQADPLAPLKHKVRMRPWDDGTRFYPSLLFHLSPSFPNEAKNLPQTPQPMIDAFKEGSLLAYLCQYGVGNTCLRRAKEILTYPFFERVDWDADRGTEEGVVLDLRYLEPYETKPDYEPYGGVAYFEFELMNGVYQLVVKWVITPRTKRKTVFNKYCGDFRRAEEMIVSSLYFETAVGKHLGELHMTYNVLSTIMVNAFDCGMNTANAPYNAHPFRLILYPHLYSHNIVVELTVNHLVQVGGYFTQVFALTQESLCDYLTTNFSLFHYAEDERFEQRILLNEPLLLKPRSPDFNQRLPSFNCSLEWELEYHYIFETYALEMMDAVYGQGPAADTAVATDKHLQNFHRGLREFIHKVPQRYDDFQTKAGVARFISDTIFHLTVKHEFYGNTGFFAAVDPRINSTQVPKDGGPPAVDEWLSLAFIFIGTAHPNFICLLQDAQNTNKSQYERELVAIFEDATPIDQTSPASVYAELRKKMKKAFSNMQVDLRKLHELWVYRGKGNRALGDENYMYFRPLPADLPTGPGY